MALFQDGQEQIFGGDEGVAVAAGLFIREGDDAFELRGGLELPVDEARLPPGDPFAFEGWQARV
jgi:hypothetical protein